MELPGLTNHSLVVLWMELAALLITARGLGSLARRLGQPTVVGELVAGLVLGPSVFAKVWPAGFHWFLPPGRPQSSLLLTVSSLALVLLLVVIGAETDLPLIKSLGRAAVLVSVASLAVPLVAGLATGALLPGSLIGANHQRSVFVLLIAGAVCVSSLPVIAKIIGGLGATRRNFGQLALAAGTANDVFGFVVVALATGLASAGNGSILQVAKTLVGLVVLLVVVVAFGQRVIDALLRRARRLGPNVTGSLAVCFGAALVAAAATQAIGVEGALGGFIAGVVLGRSRFQQGGALDHLERFSTSFLAPLYFSTAGLRVDLSVLARPAVLISFAVLTVVAALSKFGGGVLGARLARLGWRESAALGIGLNGRGALQVIIATAGLSIGVFSASAYTVVILVSILTSVATPPLLRALIRDWRGTDEEQRRLQREERLGRNIVVRGDRLLLPSRGSPNSLVAAEILHCAWPEESPITILSIGEDGDGRPHDTAPATEVLHPRTVERRHVSSDHVLDTILAEAQLGYGVIGLGAAENPEPGRLLSSVVDDLLVRSPIPLLVVRRARNLEQALPPAFARALVPVAGTASSRAGQEVAYNISQHLGTAVVLVHVVTRPDQAPAAMVSSAARDASGRDRPLGGSSRSVSRTGPGDDRSPTGAGHGILRGAESLAGEVGIDTDILVRHGAAAGPGIVATAEEVEADLIVLGATVRLIEGRPFLGHSVEHVLGQAQGTVVVVVLPALNAASGAISTGWTP